MLIFIINILQVSNMVHYNKIIQKHIILELIQLLIHLIFNQKLINFMNMNNNKDRDYQIQPTIIIRITTCIIRIQINTNNNNQPHIPQTQIIPLHPPLIPQLYNRLIHLTLIHPPNIPPTNHNHPTHSIPQLPPNHLSTLHSINTPDTKQKGKDNSSLSLMNLYQPM